MFEGFTDRARRVIVIAQDEARTIPHDHVGTGHILLGLASEDGGVASQVLGGLGVTEEAVREHLAKICPPARTAPSGHITFDKDSKKLMENALRESLPLGHNYVGTEHLLLGVARMSDCDAARILAALGHSSLAVREAVFTKIGSYQDKASCVRPGPEPVPAPPYGDVLAAAIAVAERLADLDAWIERRAARIAAPAIEVAGRAAAAEVSAAKAETQRQADLVAELRFIIASRDRVIDGLRKERDRLRQEAAREITGNG